VPDITLERDGHVAVVTLRAPERRNALTAPMVHEFMAICDEIDADQAIGAVVLTAEGASWCAGAHRDLLARVAEDPSTPDNYEALGLAYRSFVRFGDVAAPTIAAVGGHAVGAGVNLMMAADLRIVAESARIMAGFQRIGLHPGGGHFTLLARSAGREVASALGVFGEEIDGRRAVEIGLAWQALPLAEVYPRALEIAARTAADPALARATVRSMRLELGPPISTWGAALELERAPQMWSLRRRAHLM
jgi:enoyl-CoA hydratase